MSHLLLLLALSASPFAQADTSETERCVAIMENAYYKEVHLGHARKSLKRVDELCRDSVDPRACADSVERNVAVAEEAYWQAVKAFNESGCHN